MIGEDPVEMSYVSKKSKKKWSEMDDEGPAHPEASLPSFRIKK
jgi:hypothetical protein